MTGDLTLGQILLAAAGVATALGLAAIAAYTDSARVRVL